MQWLPPPTDFRKDLREAQRALDGGSAQVWPQLSSLSQHRLTYLELLQLDRLVLKAMARGETPSEGLAPLRLAVLGTCTTDHLLPGIRVAALRRGLLVQGHVGQFGQIHQETRDAASGVRQFRPQAALFCLQAKEAIGDLPLDAGQSQVDDTLERYIEDLCESWRALKAAQGTSIIQQTFLDTEASLFGHFDTSVPASPRRLIRRLNEKLIEIACREGVTLLDLESAVMRDGLHVWFDTARWLQARMLVAPSAVPAYGEHVARILAALRGHSRKCLVLDLDNTLWGGVIGDDGLEGIVLGQGSAAGEAHLALQGFAKRLAQRGIILAVCSKNDPDIAQQVFRDHPDMILRREDIACFIANWEPKEANLRRIAGELNIGLDSLVFVDDNPVERAHIRQALPMVAVPELPEDPAAFVNCVEQAGYFEAVAFTEEDRQRASQYAGNQERAAMLQSSSDAGSFLESLAMRMRSGLAQAVDLPRVAQLIGKTNQFNLTTRRHSLETVTALSRDPAAAVLQFRLEDRFGDNGLVSAMILLPVKEQPDVLDIDTWVMSCRVFGRQLEHAALNIATAIARSRGARQIRGTFIPTAKNGVVRDLFRELGFQPALQSGPEGATHWTLDLQHYQPHTTHIVDTGPS